jgi:hypothetical protein
MNQLKGYWVIGLLGYCVEGREQYFVRVRSSSCVMRDAYCVGKA